MPTLPNDNGIQLSGPVSYQEQPGLTWYCNRETGRIQGTCDQLAAVRQAVEILLWTERFRWQIYQPYTGTEYTGLIGLDAGYVGVELKRRIRAALAVDSRVTDIEDYAYTVEDGVLHATFTVRTVFGRIEGQSMEVAIS